jgi:hypothetical protein
MKITDVKVYVTNPGHRNYIDLLTKWRELVSYGRMKL